MATHVKLPDGSSATDTAAAVGALEDETCWADASSEMYISVREGTQHRMLTVIRRHDVGVCLVCKEVGDEPPGWISAGKLEAAGKSVVELEDVEVFYPHRFFVDVDDAVKALKHFCRNGTRAPFLQWIRLRPDDLKFVPFELPTN